MAGSVTEPIAAVSALEEPEMPENSMVASTTTRPRPPRIPPTNTVASATMRRAMPPCPMMAPDRMNSGMARSGNESMWARVLNAYAAPSMPAHIRRKRATSSDQLSGMLRMYRKTTWANSTSAIATRMAQRVASRPRSSSAPRVRRHRPASRGAIACESDAADARVARLFEACPAASTR
jgi:hypothetical protein